jgi:hypothetical protein
VEWNWVDEQDDGFGWQTRERIPRTSHALLAGGRVWLIDPVDVDGLDDRVRALGEAGGVLQLLDRHNRDCAELAERYGVPHHRLPFSGIEGTALESISVIRNRLWNEVAIWSPADRALIVPEAVGTARYFRAGDEAVGIHPMLRMLPPNRLRDHEPEHLLTGHGTGMHGPGTAAALRDALSGSRRRTPQAALSILRSAVGR